MRALAFATHFADNSARLETWGRSKPRSRVTREAPTGRRPSGDAEASYFDALSMSLVYEDRDAEPHRR